MLKVPGKKRELIVFDTNYVIFCGKIGFSWRFEKGSNSFETPRHLAIRVRTENFGEFYNSVHHSKKSQNFEEHDLERLFIVDKYFS